MEQQESILTDIETTEVEVTHGQRILSNVIDFVLELGLLVLFYLLLPNDMRAFLIKYKPVSTYIVIFIWFTVYRLLTILLMQRTIGMIICRSKYLNEHFQPLSSGEKLIVTFATITKKIRIFKA